MVCTKCGYKAEKKDNIIFFESGIGDGVNYGDYGSRNLDKLYKYEQTSFWFKIRKEIILNVFKKYINKEMQILELGAGTGNIAGMLNLNGFKVSVGEIHKKGVYYAKSYGIKNCYQFDMMRPPFKEHFDCIGFFDVLEHLENDSDAVAKIHFMLKKNGYIILTVPANRGLWSRMDNLAGHKRRYDALKMRTVLMKNGFKVMELKYLFSALVPFLYIRKLLCSIKFNVNRERELQQKMLENILINRVLHFISTVEFFLFTKVPMSFGSSILAVARKI